VKTRNWQLGTGNWELATGNWQLPPFMKELRIALLGQGFMGKAHSNAYVQAGHFFDLPYRIRRRLLCGRDQTALTAMAERWGWEETATDWRAAIDRDDIDAVDISLPNHLHAPVALAAAQAGKMILCEKPLALNLAEAEAMRDAARGVPTMVWFNYRRVPAIAFARQLIDQGRIGTVFHYDAAYRQQWGADLSRAATWRMDPALAGSGVADDLLTHLLDTALDLNGPILEGVALTRTFAPDRKVDDAFVAIVKFENGSIGTFEATRFGIGIKNGNAFQIHGANGMLRFNLERLNHLEFVDATQPSTEQGPRDLLVTDPKHPIFGNFWRPGHIIGYEHTFIAALAEFLFAVSKNERFRPDFADGVEVQRVLEALQRSARTREWTAVARDEVANQ
jgi:predicted dehydrogenase